MTFFVYLDKYCIESDACICTAAPYVLLVEDVFSVIRYINRLKHIDYRNQPS